ncbi:hypothetical protein OG599_12250 [Streptomyces sp. NBC_01335]|uniref:hypothetical protein n=1 Tax=Streptomyces sp. NBC_01335 TaxID=2903828 RepID=UPI002E146903|nr:hypothetical protein OG599_12250 [Streptomyces sp. NBC_01335]
MRWASIPISLAFRASWGTTSVCAPSWLVPIAPITTTVLAGPGGEHRPVREHLGHHRPPLGGVHRSGQPPPPQGGELLTVEIEDAGRRR